MGGGGHGEGRGCPPRKQQARTDPLTHLDVAHGGRPKVVKQRPERGGGSRHRARRRGDTPRCNRREVRRSARGRGTVHPTLGIRSAPRSILSDWPGSLGKEGCFQQPGCPTPGANPTPPRPLAAQPGKLRLDQGRWQASGLQNSDPGGTPAHPGQTSIGAESEPHLSGPGSRALGCWSRGCCWGRGRWVCRTSPTPGCGGRRPAAPPGLAAWPPSRALIGRRRARPL